MSDNIQNKDDLIKQSGNSQEDSHLPNSKNSKQNPIYEAVIVKKDEALLKLMKLETLKALNFNFITTNPIINQYLEREYQNLGNSIVNNIAGISGITNNFKTLNLITTELTSNNQTPLTSQTPNNPILPILPTSPMPYTPNNINNDTINLILNINRFKENCGDKILGLLAEAKFLI